MEIKKVAVIVGSLRKESFNRKIAKEMIRLAPKNLDLKIVEIKDLSFFNEDVEKTPPQEWTDFKNEIKNSEAVIFVSPEYNRTMPGVLKNAMEIGSRPPKENSWQGKPGAVMTVTPGAIGGLGAHNNIREALTSLDIPTMQQPAAYIGGVKDRLLEDGVTVNEATEKFLTNYLLEFEKWILRF